MRWDVVPSPVGDLWIAADERGICRVTFAVPPVPAPRPAELARGAPEAADALLARAAAQLRGYFAGELTSFDLPLSVPRGSDFERAVWRALRGIPYAEMRTYGQIAAATGELGAARAVGVACNRNPLPVIVACHRVVGAGGKLVGFGGGLSRKRLLLELEARVRVEREFS